MSIELSPELINLGAAPNDGQGDNLREAFGKVNTNFQLVFNRGLPGSNLGATGNAITALDTNGNIVLVPNGSGVVNVSNAKVINVGAPTTNTDAANKLYVDNAISTAVDLIGGTGGLTEILNPATPSNNGYMTMAYASKLEGIEDSATADMTASEILFQLKSVDGVGSGLDAEMLGGMMYTSYITTSTLAAETSNRINGDTTTLTNANNFTNTSITALINGAPPNLNTLGEIANAIGLDPSFSATVNTALSNRLVRSNNLSDLTNVSTARTNLGLSTVASTGDYSDLTGKPTTVSSFTNDSGYVNATGARASISGNVATGIDYAAASGIISANTSVLATRSYVDAAITSSTSGVTSVNGINGTVVLTTDNVAEGSINQYSTPTRIRSSLSFAAGIGAYNSSTGVITIPTNTNQLINGAGFLTTESDTLNTVTTRGATTAAAIQITNATASTSTTTGAFIVSGGVGISGNTHVGGTIFGIATSAQYADLAEKYESDLEYEPGTVVVFGGEKTITVSMKEYDSAVAGVISTAPAYTMNSESAGLPVALTGMVPCNVLGPVTKGQLLVTSNIPGVAMALHNVKWVPGCVIGKAIEDINDHQVKIINVVVGRF